MAPTLFPTLPTWGVKAQTEGILPDELEPRLLYGLWRSSMKSQRRPVSRVAGFLFISCLLGTVISAQSLPPSRVLDLSAADGITEQTCSRSTQSCRPRSWSGTRPP